MLVKPRVITVFGIIHLIYGGLGILCLPMEFYYENDHGYEYQSAPHALLSYFDAIIMPIITFVLGIGLLNSKSWAHSGSIKWMKRNILLQGILLIFHLFSVSNIPTTNDPLEAFAAGAMISAFVFVIIYSLLTIIFLSTKKVKTYFSSLPIEASNKTGRKHGAKTSEGCQLN